MLKTAKTIDSVRTGSFVDWGRGNIPTGFSSIIPWTFDEIVDGVGFGMLGVAVRQALDMSRVRDEMMGEFGGDTGGGFICLYGRRGGELLDWEACEKCQDG